MTQHPHSTRPLTDIGPHRGAAAEAMMPFPRLAENGRVVIARQRRDVVLLLAHRGRLEAPLVSAAQRLQWDHERSTGHAAAPPPAGSLRGGSRSLGSGWPADSVVAASERFGRATATLHGLEAITIAALVLHHGSVADLARSRRMRRATILLALRRGLEKLAAFYTDEPQGNVLPPPDPKARAGLNA